MTVSTISDTIRTKLGINSLNAMQQQIASAELPQALMLLSPTGSGKTLAFVIAMLRLMGKPSGNVQAVVTVPSRELAMQVGEVTRRVAAGFKVATIYGGHSMREEAATLSVVPDIIVGTPGRLLDHLQRGQLSLNGVKVLVLDEWDKILQLGFHEEMRKICRRITPPPAHVILTSATRDAEIPAWLPVKGGVKVMDFGSDSGSAVPPQVDMIEVPSPTPDKLTTLTELLFTLRGKRVIVFVNHRESASRVYEALRKQGIPAGLYTGELDQLDRQNALEMLLNGTTPVLVATDLGARGIDVKELDAVIHYHLPLTADAWTHRNGRTGRMGAKGEVYVITSEKDSLPDDIRFDRSLTPAPKSVTPWDAPMATLYINAGKKDKISRGDIVGYITAHTPLTGAQIGRIALYDRAALVAVPSAEAAAVIELLKPQKLKGKRVRVSRLDR
ncbi:MAG: DEAD/DEAH box helicase [Candidatus Amulumruptor caecigallinarius]|nr:DEAD/DEAH box helicase [Candidatus Amulumruptor caecigallinarius]MCM1396185.1 DEAD/DEAH box helicase [Candidatus Amulumruptor caecigallinarius]MCM1453815.1 DEAD/DEAH box helicase [bacterium]